MANIKNTELLFAKHSCRIVFVKDHTAGALLSAQLTREHPEYISGISERLSSTKKVGPFRVKNKQSLYHIYLKTKAIKKVLADDGRETADRDIRLKMDLMELRGFEDRAPRALSNLQKLRASILCDVLDGKFEFIISDCSTQTFDSLERRLNFKSIYLTIARFMKNSDDFEWVPCDLIWISDTNSDEMLTILGEEDYRSDFYSFYQIENGCIVELDRETLIKGFTPIQIAPAVSEAPAAKPKSEPKPQAKSQSNPAHRTEIKTDEFGIDGAFEFLKADQYYKAGNYAEAYPLMERAAEAGNKKAWFAFASMNESGKGCTADEKKALYWYERAAKVNDRMAQFYCGWYYYNGKGCQKDDEKAFFWMERSAEQGYADAQFVYGVMCFNGYGCISDSKKGIAWLKKAAAQDHPDAIKQLKTLFP